MADPEERQPLKFVEPTAEEMVTKLSFGEAVRLGQMCPECPAEHYCDALCFRFYPRTFLCQGCGQYQRHRKMEPLIEDYKANKKLDKAVKRVR